MQNDLNKFIMYIQVSTILVCTSQCCKTINLHLCCNSMQKFWSQWCYKWDLTMCTLSYKR